MNIKANIEGLIRELGLGESDFLIPLYEMIVNAIQAIREINSSKFKGKITIEIKRDKSQHSLFEELSNYPIESISISDNGIGFTSENFDSFAEAYSSKKKVLGGKGIGRFAALSFFSKIDVSSVFHENGNYYKKKFYLSSNSGLSDPDSDKLDSNISANKTIITLSELLPKFQKVSAKYSLDKIAECLTAHCILFFLSETAPTIIVKEDNTQIQLDTFFNPKKFIIKAINSDVKEHRFAIYFIRNNKKAHSLCYCANSRKVKSKKITTILPIFSSPIIDEEGSETYLDIYVVSTYLDNLVNSSRTDIKFPKEEDVINPQISGFDTLLSEKNVEDIVIQAIYDSFSNEIGVRRERVKESVRKYISSDFGIGYRHLDLEEDFYDSLPDDITDKKLDDYLHEADYIHSKKRRDAYDKLKDRDYSENEDYQQLLTKYLSLSTKEGLSRLGQYVTHRKTIIDLLEKYLNWTSDNQDYEQESTLHNLIYTMQGSNNTIRYDHHNLWLLDDRLAFHRYIHSDKQIRLHIPVKGVSDCCKETDIAIYDTMFTYGEKNEYEQVQSVMIFELKRPNRQVSYAEFNKQMLEQIEGIEAGAVKDYNGANVMLPPNTPITFYYVCDANTFELLKKSCNIDGYNITPYNSLLKLNKHYHIEIMTYQTLLINARRRNLIFFKYLGLSI